MGKTIYQSFLETAIRYSDRTALMYREQGQSLRITYRALRDSADAVAAGLRKLGISREDTVGIFSCNRPEWPIADLAVLKLGGIVVPIYHRSPAPCVKQIMNDSKIKLVFVENADRFSLIDDIRNELPYLKNVVLFEGSGISPEKAIMRFKDMEKLGNRAVGPDPSFSVNDVATIVYTSGTTGEPKGVMLTHGNIVSNALAAIKRFKVTPKDTIVSYLPLSHMFERTSGYYTLLFAGGCIAYAEKMTTVVDDVKEIRPTILLAVPRVIEKIYDEVVEKVERNPFIKRKLISLAIKNFEQCAHLNYRKENRSFACRIKCGLYNMLVASRFRKLGGGKLRLLVSGGAPLNPHIGKMLSILRFNIVEGYGLTETAPMVCCNTVEENQLGTVGKPLDGVEVKIGAYGEILVRGPNVMLGYLNKPEDTMRAIDHDTWFHTGDQGRFDEAGNLIITGRIKELIVTSYGKKVAPLPIEKRISESKYIDQVMLYGDKKKCLVALIAPSKEAIQHNATKKDIEREIEGKTAGLAPYERIKAFALLPEGFTTENEMLTPTLKLRRAEIVGMYAGLIDAMYENLEKKHEN